MIKCSEPGYIGGLCSRDSFEIKIINYQKYRVWVYNTNTALESFYFPFGERDLLFFLINLHVYDE